MKSIISLIPLIVFSMNAISQNQLSISELTVTEKPVYNNTGQQSIDSINLEISFFCENPGEINEIIVFLENDQQDKDSINIKVYHSDNKTYTVKSNKKLYVHSNRVIGIITVPKEERNKLSYSVFIKDNQGESSNTLYY